MATTDKNPSSSHASGSLYVGDLQPDVTEAILFELFNQVGPVSSIRVCRDAATRRSLGYAYVNFHNVLDAERARDTLNFHPIKNRPCRIMWSQRDPAIRKTNVGNIFIKNLDKSIDNKALFDTFSAFGNIISCKVATDKELVSKGYAFVHYETEEAALKAIEKVNGHLLNQKPVYVGKFERRTERLGGSIEFTNVYVKNIPEDWTEEILRREFSKFGKITSLLLKKVEGDETKHKGFGFVNYEQPEEAQRAVDEGSKLVLGDKSLYVGRFQRRAERAELLAQKYKHLNLYVKNLEEDVDDTKLKAMFAEFGEISSAVVMRDDKGNSKGFGFVCFTTPEEVNKALTEMNGKTFGTKPIYVNHFQSREERRMQLGQDRIDSHSMQTQRFFQAGPRPKSFQPIFYPQNQMMQPGMIYPQQMIGHHFPSTQMRYPVFNPSMKSRRPAAPGGRPVPSATRGGGPPQRFRSYPPRSARDQMQVPTMQVPPAVAAPIAAQVAGHELDSRMLASLPPDVQKQILGERLFPLVHQEQPELAGKITGMLLEMEVAEILSVLQSPSERSLKIAEAMDVLESHGQ